MKRNNLYTWFDQFIFRTPLLPVNRAANTYTEELDNLIAGDTFKDAMYLSSPDLYNTALDNEAGTTEDKVRNSLLKYFFRSKFRCTPFGLMAGLGMGAIGKNPSGVTLDQADKYNRHTRLDMNYLCNLTQELGKATFLRKYLRYYPNSSMYYLGGKIRYVEYHYSGGKRNHVLTMVDNNEYLAVILQKAQTGCYIDDLIALLDDDSIDISEKRAFIDEIIDSQLLVSELEPAVTGEEMDLHVIRALDTILKKDIDKEDFILISGIYTRLCEINRTLKQVDKAKINSGNISAYARIEEFIKELGYDYKKKYLLQADLIVTAEKAELNESVCNDILDAVDVMSRFTPKEDNKNLKEFRERFYQRWEEQEIPLVLALDTEQGIGYIKGLGESMDINPLVDDLVLFPPGTDASSLTVYPSLYNFWFNKLTDALKNDMYEIRLEEKDIESFPSRQAELPPTFYVMASLVKGKDLTQPDSKNIILMKGLGGSTSANLLGRFCHSDASIDAFTRQMATKEKELFPGKIIAEIAHLPESRLGNILCRPHIRDYEITYLSGSGAGIVNKIPITDLMISIKNNRIVLRSKRLGREVIPRLTTAHSFSYKSLPVYHFLCDLQVQNCINTAYLDLGYAKYNAKFTPRITYKGNIILNPANWKFLTGDYEHLLHLKGAALQTAFDEFKQKWKLPAFIAIMKGDNELVIDTAYMDCVQVFINEIKSKEVVTVVEHIVDSSYSLIRQGAKSFANELIVPFYRTKEIYPAVTGGEASGPGDTAQHKRNFYPGEEWVYYKIYTGLKSADEILTGPVKKLTNRLLDLNVIDQWFFIRYTDPHFHIRLRLRLTDRSNFYNVCALVNNELAAYLDSEIVWDLQLNTYKRELERYGPMNMDGAEQVFFKDSEAVVLALDQLEGAEGEQLKWLVAIKTVNDYLNIFRYTDAQKKAFATTYRDSFAREFGSHKLVKRQLDAKFRGERAMIEKWIHPGTDGFIAEEGLLPLFEILENRNTCIAGFADELADQENPEKKMNLVGSFIHMHVNRLFRTKNRLHEYVIYDLLERYYHYKIGSRIKTRQNDAVI